VSHDLYVEFSNSTHRKNLDWNDPEYQRLYDEYQEKSNAAGRRELDRIVRMMPPETVIYCIEYGDENGSFEATIEHGDTFRNITHKRVSHH
jgi:hypothetical protein